jgi:hypothetical protein
VLISQIWYLSQRQEAIDLVDDSIRAGIFNDLGSGSNVDVTVIEKSKVDVLRNYAKPNERGIREGVYDFAVGTTSTLTFILNCELIYSHAYTCCFPLHL